MARTTINLVDESRSPSKTIFLLAWPVFVEQILTTLVSYADTAMVGSLGAWATAAVSISNPPIFLLNGMVMALGVGITSLIARGVGAGELDKVRKLIRHAVLVAIFLGVPICAVVGVLHRVLPLWMGAEPDVLEAAAQYNLIIAVGRVFMNGSMMLNAAFRGYGDTKTPLVVHTIMNIVNVILNFFLIYPTREITVFGSTFTIFGAGLEVVGAGIATAAGMAVACGLNFYVAFFRKNEYRISLKDNWKLDKGLCRQIFRISLPAMLERICMSSAGILVNKSVASLGTIRVAANSLCLTAESLSYMPAFAFQTGITTLVGQSLGANKPQLAEKFVNKSILIGSLIMLVSGTGLYVFSNQIISIFTPDAAVIELSAQCLRVVALLQIPQVIGWIYSGALRGAGDTKFNFYITAATTVFVRTLLSVIAVRVLHKDLVFIQYIIGLELVSRLFLLYLRYRSGKWKEVFLESPRAKKMKAE